MLIESLTLWKCVQSVTIEYTFALGFGWIYFIEFYQILSLLQWHDHMTMFFMSVLYHKRRFSDSQLSFHFQDKFYLVDVLKCSCNLFPSDRVRLSPMRDNCFWNKSLLLTVVPKRRGHVTPCRGHRGKYQCQSGGRRSDGEIWVPGFILVFMGRNGQGKVSVLGLVSLNNFSRLPAMEKVPSCRVPDPGAT